MSKEKLGDKVGKGSKEGVSKEKRMVKTLGKGMEKE